MARCDIASARIAGISCGEFYQRQARVASQVQAYRESLRALGAARSGGSSLRQREQSTAARFDKYMGAGSSGDSNKIALAHNVLLNAERQLRNAGALAEFDRGLAAGGEATIRAMRLGNPLNDNTILHEAVHFGTHPIRSQGEVPFVRDEGNVSISNYGTLHAALQRARFGWAFACKSAASYSWLVTGP